VEDELFISEVPTQEGDEVHVAAAVAAAQEASVLVSEEEAWGRRDQLQRWRLVLGAGLIDEVVVVPWVEPLRLQSGAQMRTRSRTRSSSVQRILGMSPMAELPSSGTWTVKQEARGGWATQKATWIRLPSLVKPSAVVSLVRSLM
jgi:hypothetical protein